MTKGGSLSLPLITIQALPTELRSHIWWARLVPPQLLPKKTGLQPAAFADSLLTHMVRNRELESHGFHHASLSRGASDHLSLFRIQMCVLIAVLHRPSIFKNRTHKVQGWGWRRRWVPTPLIVFLRSNWLATSPLCQHWVLLHIGASGEIRTHNLLITNQLRYHCATLAYKMRVLNL